MIRVIDEEFDPSAALGEFLTRAGEGAVASFTGVVRADNDVDCLVIQHYPQYTERELERIASEVQRRHKLTAVEIVHRVGKMKPGEAIMFAATSALHRRAAIDGLDELMDRLKTDAPFWKREEAVTGDRWLEATPADVVSRERWNNHD